MYKRQAQGNAIGDPLGEMAGRNVLYLAREAASADVGSDPEQDAAVITDIENRLLAARQQRPAVPVDDKIVAEWNGYMLTTLALAGRLLDEPRYIEAAKDAAGFLMQSLYDEASGTLHRDWRGGRRGVAGFSADYAAMAEGLLMLYKVTGERRWLRLSRSLVDSMLARFRDDAAGGFYLATADKQLWLREKPASDGASLAVNTVAIHVLLDLARLAGEPAYADLARQTAAWLQAQQDNNPAGMTYALIRWPELLRSASPVRQEPPG